MFLERSHQTYLALLATLRSGYIYVPLERSLPKNLINKIIKECDISWVISDAEGIAALEQAEAEQPPFIDISEVLQGEELLPEINTPRAAANIAMIFFTSGSTGSPKGVKHTQLHLLNRLHWIWNRFAINDQDVVCQRAPLNYLPSMWELFAGLLKGNRTLILSDRIVKDPKSFTEALVKYGVTWINIVPSLLNMLFESKSEAIEKLQQIRLWITCGEKLSLSSLNKHREKFPKSTLLNDYGATEVNGVLYFTSTAESPQRFTRLPAFQSIANVAVRLLDKQGEKCKPYYPGQIHIGGSSIAKGYLDQKINQQKFVVLSTPEGKRQKYFAMGDWAYQDATGGLHLIGRFDNIVKIRGNRIDLNGLGEKIKRLPSVAD